MTTDFKPRIHLVPNKQTNTWIVKMEGEEEGQRFETKKEAGRCLVSVARVLQTAKVVHGLNGRFMSNRSY